MLKISKNAVGMLSAKYRSVLQNMSSKNAAVLAVCCLLAGAPALGGAEDIRYEGNDPSKLQIPPWCIGGEYASIFPGNPEKLGYMGNRVTIEYNPLPSDPDNIIFGNGLLSDPLYHPRYVFGGLSVTYNVTGNKVYFKNGATAEIYGGYAKSTTASVTNNEVTIENGFVGSGLEGGNVYGGYLGGGNDPVTGSVSNNNVTVLGGVVNSGFGGNVYGGYIDTREPSIATGIVSKNNVLVDNNSQITGSVYGGYHLGVGSVENNSATVKNGDIGYGVYGGFAHKGMAIGNTANVSGGTINYFAVGGYSVDGDAIGNNTYVSGGTIKYFVYGGWSATGSAIGNTVTISDSANIGYSVYGGYARARSGEISGDVVANEVSVSGGTIGSHVYGGSAINSTGAVFDNSVTVSGGKIVKNVYGGRSASSGVTAEENGFENSIQNKIENKIQAEISNTGEPAGYRSLLDTGVGEVFGNGVIVTGGEIGGNVYGGQNANETGNASDNGVLVTGGEIGGNVYGGQSVSGNAVDNIVIAYGNGTITIDGTVYGGQSVNGAATGNIAVVAGGAVINGSAESIFGDAALPDGINSVFGGWSESGSADNNSVIIAGGTVNGTVYGGATPANGNANYNNVIIFDGNITGSVYGGVSAGDEASGNYVDIIGGTIGGSVYGGWSTGDTKDNTITISGSPDLTAASLSGGNNSVTGNTLNVYSYMGSDVQSISNFENYDFLLPATLQNNSTFLTTGSWNNDTNPVTVQGVNIESGGAALKTGDTVKLISSDSTITTVNFTDTTIEGMKGVSLLYNFDLKLNDAGNKALTATVASVSAHPQTKAFSEGRAAGMGFLNHGSDLAADKGMGDALNQTGKSGNGPAVFGAMSYGSTRYDTGSHADVNAFSLLAGVASRSKSADGSLLKGIFLEGGWGNYDTYNSFTNSPSVRAGGDVGYFGLGALIRRDAPSGSYVEGSLRGGKSKTTFASGDFAGQSTNVSYTSKPAYYGAHVGVGRLQKKGAKTVDYYAKYFWTHQNGDNVTVLGDPVNFSPSNSHRLRGGVRLSQERPDGRIATYAGLAYEHEFDGKARATVYGHDIESPSLKGGTGIIELGVSWKNSVASNNSLHLGLQGYVGQRKGLSGNVQFRRMF